MKTEREQFAQFLQRRFGGRSTRKHYLNDLDLFIRFLGDKPATAVTAADVEQFVSDQLSQRLSPSTVNRRLATLRTFFEHMAALKPEADWPNPVVWQRHKVKAGELLPRDASDAQVTALFAAIDSDRDRAMFGLMVGAGLRVGEVVSLEQAAVTPPTEAGGLARLRVKGKGDKERAVWLTPYWYAVVQAWQAQRPAVGCDQLFLNQHGQKLSVGGVQYRLRQVCAAANVKLTCHQLRHTFARRLAEQGMSTESIGFILGHRNVQTTQRYTAGANRQLRQAFLTAMEGYIPTSANAENTDSEINALPPPRQPDSVDEGALTAALARLETLPAWLAPLLQAYVRHRWVRWPAHRAAANVSQLSRQLVNTWGQLLAVATVGGWEGLSRRVVERWLHDRAQVGIAVNTQRTQLTALLSSLRFACDHGHPVAANVLRTPMPQRTAPLPRYLAPTDFAALVAHVLQQTEGVAVGVCLARAWFLTLAHTGIRTCELLDLRLADIDLVGRRLFIRGGKNYNDRSVPLTQPLLVALGAYLRLRPTSTDDHVWLRPDGRRLPAWLIRERLARWGAAVGVTVSPHRLRHTLATLLLNQGVSLTVVGKLLGHKKLDTTQHYARLFDSTVKAEFSAAVAQIEGIAAPNWPQPARRQAKPAEIVAT